MACKASNARGAARPASSTTKSFPITVSMAARTQEGLDLPRGSYASQRTRAYAPDTTYAGVAAIKPALPGGVIAAGNASQFSDGAAACVVMSADAAARRV